MQITLTFNIEQINVILHSLDNGPHKEVRPLIDFIITEANAQREAFAAAQVQPMPTANPDQA